MRTFAFAGRNHKEMTRDGAALGFALGMPLLMLVIWMIIAKAVPGDFMPANFQLGNYIPGVALFGMTFLSMFLGILIAQDRATSYLGRLFAGPMRTQEYLLGYMLPMLPLALMQILLVLVIGLLIGLSLTVGQVLATAGLLLLCVPMFLSMGLFLGSLLGDKAVAPVSSILVQLMALTSGMMLDVEMIGGGYGAFCKVLPFYHGLRLCSGVTRGDMSGWLSHALVVIGYTMLMSVLALIVFRKRQKN